MPSGARSNPLAGTFAFASSYLPRAGSPANPSAPASPTTQRLNSANSPKPSPSRTGTLPHFSQSNQPDARHHYDRLAEWVLDRQRLADEKAAAGQAR